MNKTKFRRWITVCGGVITEVHASNTEQPGMVEVPWNAEVKPNTRIETYGKNWKTLSEKELVENGFYIDNRGRYWNKGNYLDTLEIVLLNVKAPEGFTSAAPIPGEPCVWEDGGWVTDEAEKERRAAILDDARVREFVSGLAGGVPAADMLGAGKRLGRELSLAANALSGEKVKNIP